MCSSTEKYSLPSAWSFLSSAHAPVCMTGYPYPRSLTIFLCWSFETRLSSSYRWFRENIFELRHLLMATTKPSFSTPWKMQQWTFNKDKTSKLRTCDVSVVMCHVCLQLQQAKLLKFHFYIETGLVFSLKLLKKYDSPDSPYFLLSRTLVCIQNTGIIYIRGTSLTSTWLDNM